MRPCVGGACQGLAGVRVGAAITRWPRGAKGTGRCWRAGLSGAASGPLGCPPGIVRPGGRARRRRSSNCARAAICWANSAVWMPWNSPSSQPTSWACATRSSASEGHRVVGERQRDPLELLDELGCEALLELLDRAGVDLLQARPARLVQLGRANLLEQLLDHAADPHHLGRLVDHCGDGTVVHLVVARGPPRRPSRSARPRRPAGPSDCSGC